MAARQTKLLGALCRDQPIADIVQGIGSRGWKCGLDNKPWEAIGFYAVIATATGLGLAIDLMAFDPIKALYWSAVINGVISVPIMAAIMVVARSTRQWAGLWSNPGLPS